jgi:hypothetical protein
MVNRDHLEAGDVLLLTVQHEPGKPPITKRCVIVEIGAARKWAGGTERPAQAKRLDTGDVSEWMFTQPQRVVGGPKFDAAQRDPSLLMRGKFAPIWLGRPVAASA